MFQTSAISRAISRAIVVFPVPLWPDSRCGPLVGVSLAGCSGAVSGHFASRLRPVAWRVVAGFAFALGVGRVTRAAAAGFALGLDVGVGFATGLGLAG